MPKILAIGDINNLEAIINETFPGAIVMTALNGHKGIELAIANNPDVIMLDIIMPGMDGFEVCRQLKLDERVKDIPVVFLTPMKGDKESQLKALEVGADGFLSKPIDEIELLAQIRAMVKIKAANGQERDKRERLERLVEERTRDLVQSHVLLKGIFENLQDAYFQTDIKGNFTVVSPSAIKMYGFESVDELIGQPAEILYFDHQERDSMIAGLKSKGYIQDYTCRGRKKDGTAFWVSMNVQLIRNNEGKVTSTEGVVRDISERIKVEKALSESEEKYRIMVDLMPDAVIIHEGGQFVFANAAALKTVGADSYEQLTERPLMNYVHPDFRNASLGRIKEIYSTGLPSRFSEEKFITLSDEIIDVEVIGIPILYRGKSAIQTIIRDITKRKKDENVLKESEERFRHISSSISDISYSCINDLNRNSSINWLFGATEKITGYTIDELFALKCWGKLVVEEDFPIFNSHILNVLPGKSETCQLRLKRKDGNIVWIQANAECVKGPEGTGFNTLYGGLIDITERKQAEELLLEREYFFKESQQAAFIGSYRFDIVANHWTSSEVLELIFGIDKNFTRSYEGWFEIAHPDDREMMARYFSEEVISKRQPFNKEYRIIRKSDGETRWVLGLGKLNFDAEDNVTEMVGTIQDITNRKLAEEARNESYEFNQTLLKTIPFGMDIVDKYGNILFQNQNFENFFGKKVIGARCWELYRDDKTQCPDCPLRKGIEVGKTDVYESSGVLGGRVFEIKHTGMMFRGKKAMLEIFQDITERKQAEEALREREQLFRGLFNASPDAIVLIDPNHPTISWPIVDCNEASCRMNGYTREEMIGQSIDLLNVSAEKPEKRKTYYNELKKESIVHTETIHRHKDGHAFPIEVSTSIVVIGGREMVLGIDRDITERKQAEMALKESEDRYRQFVSQVSEGVYRFECDQPMSIDLPVEEQVDFLLEHSYLAECNDAYLKMYDVRDLSEIIGKITMSNHLSGQNTINRNSLRHFVENGYNVKNQITEEVNVAGLPLFISNNAVGIIENNCLVRMWGTQTDITEKLRDEKVQQVLYAISNAALSSSDLSDLIKLISDELGQLLDSTNFFIAFYDEKTNMLSTIYEKDEKDILQTWSAEKSVTGYVVRNQKSMLLREHDIKNLVESGEIEIYGTLSKVWVGVPLFAENKVIGAIVVQSYDNPDAYTEKDKLMLEFISHQVSICVERKKAEQELNTAVIKAKESDRLKSAFLANMSHEIRTPLNSIIGFSELMADPGFDASQQSEFAQIIINSGNSLLTIISDIMDFSKIEAGQVVVNKTPFVLQKLISSLQNEYSFTAREKGIELRVDPQNPKDDIWVRSDENRLKQVLVNLVGNAIKFTKEGFVELGVKLIDDSIQFKVSDTGIGIPEKYHNEIFERFRQVESSNSRKYGGNGLGLAICKNLVEIMGGKIWIKSVVGKGSTFYFTIPIGLTTT